MGRLRSPAFYALIFLAAAAIAAAAGFLCGRADAEKTARAYLTELCGRLGALTAELSDEEAKSAAFTYIGSYSDEDISRGETLLAPYGYSMDMRLGNISRYRESAVGQGIFCAAAALLAFIIAGMLLLVILRLYFKELENICRSAEQICSGKSYSEDGALYGALRTCSNVMARLSNHAAALVSRLDNGEKYVRQLISDISHQMKTPVAAVRMNQEIILGEPDMPLETREDFLGRSLSQLDHLEWLIAGLLKSARMDSGAIEFDLRENRPRIAAEEAFGLHSAEAAEKGITLENKVPGEITMIMDIRWLTEALGNLVKNSLEHTPEGGRITIEGTETPLTVSLFVKDNGSGIDRRELPHIFERFYSGSSEERSVKNVGIGLSVTKSIIERHNGSIRASSGANGTVFTVTFLRMKGI